MSLTSAQWEDIERKLSTAFGCVRLRVPGHEITVEVRSIGKLRYAPVVFVDGGVRVEYLMPVDNPIGRRFYQLHTRSLIPKAKAEADFKRLKRVFGAVEARRLSGLGKTYSWRSAEWRSPKALCAHLRKNEPEIELIEESIQ